MPQTSKCRGVSTAVYNDDKELIVIYRGTKLVHQNKHSGTIILRTGGWKTFTTKTRMNQAANEFNLGYTVYQLDKDWYISYKNTTYPFINDTIQLKE